LFSGNKCLENRDVIVGQTLSDVDLIYSKLDETSVIFFNLLILIYKRLEMYR